MELLITLIIALILAVIFFAFYPIVKRKILSKKYSYFCSRKIRKIASKNDYLFLTNLNLVFYSSGKAGIDHILFGKKYIFILSNYYIDGDIKGTIENNSWILEKRRDKTNEYIDNISNDLSEKSMVFSQKINVNQEIIIPIAIINNECEINVQGINKNNTFVVHYSSLNKLIKKIDSRTIGNLYFDQVKSIYENLKDESN